MSRTGKLLTALLGLVTLLSLMILLMVSCAARLSVTLDSIPAGASIVIEDVEKWWKTPAGVSSRFPPKSVHDGFVCFSVELSRGAELARGKILCWDGGFPYPVFIRRVESVDGSAWTTPFNESTVQVRFAKPRNFYF